MSDLTFYRTCKRCGSFMSFPRPPVGIVAEGEDKPEELVEWERMRDSPNAAFEHGAGMCPDEIAAAAVAAIGQHRYKVKITVLRDDEVVAEIGSTEREALRFSDVSEQVSRDLNEKWDRVLSMSGTFDQSGGETDGGPSAAE